MEVRFAIGEVPKEFKRQIAEEERKFGAFLHIPVKVRRWGAELAGCKQHCTAAANPQLPVYMPACTPAGCNRLIPWLQASFETRALLSEHGSNCSWSSPVIPHAWAGRTTTKRWHLRRWRSGSW